MTNGCQYEQTMRRMPMKYRLFENSLNNKDNIIETVLRNRGIDNPQEYLHFDEAHCDDYHKLDNIYDAVECFNKHFERGDDIAVLVDCDP